MSDQRDEEFLERENARLTGVLRRVRNRLEHALETDGDGRAMRAALEDAKRAADDAAAAEDFAEGHRGQDSGTEGEEKGRINPPPSEVLGESYRGRGSKMNSTG